MHFYYRLLGYVRMFVCIFTTASWGLCVCLYAFLLPSAVVCVYVCMRFYYRLLRCVCMLHVKYTYSICRIAILHVKCTYSICRIAILHVKYTYSVCRVAILHVKMHRKGVSFALATPPQPNVKKGLQNAFQTQIHVYLRTHENNDKTRYFCPPAGGRGLPPVLGTM